MEYLIGAVLAAVVFAFARFIGFDRDRVFYPTLLIVIATYYILFAVIGTSVHALLIESLVASSFLVIAVAGFKKNLWLVVAALAGHGIFDFFPLLSRICGEILVPGGVPSCDKGQFP